MHTKNNVDKCKFIKDIALRHYKTLKVVLTSLISKTKLKYKIHHKPTRSQPTSPHRPHWWTSISISALQVNTMVSSRTSMEIHSGLSCSCQKYSFIHSASFLLWLILALTLFLLDVPFSHPSLSLECSIITGAPYEFSSTVGCWVQQ